MSTAFRMIYIEKICHCIQNFYTKYLKLDYLDYKRNYTRVAGFFGDMPNWELLLRERGGIMLHISGDC